MARAATPLPADADVDVRRLQGDERRAALLRSAAAILASDGLNAVTMDRVAAAAGVSRPLVYKHFANRHDLLAALFRDQAAELDRAIVAAVQAASGFEGKIRALIHAALDAETEYGPVIVPLVRARLDDARFQDEQRARDRRTVSFFARLAVDEFGLDRDEARAAMAALLMGIESIRAQARTRVDAARRRFLEDVYVDTVVGALAHLGATRSRGRGDHSRRGAGRG